jgi:hypothetical protein
LSLSRSILVVLPYHRDGISAYRTPGIDSHGHYRKRSVSSKIEASENTVSSKKTWAS